MFKILIPAVAALGLTAFGAHTTVPAVEAPAEYPAMSWSLHHEGTIAKLTYGVENSDHLALMMTCRPGDAQAVVQGDVHPTAARMVAEPVDQDPMMIDPWSARTSKSRLLVQDASLRGLARGGQIDVRGDTGMLSLKADASERRAVSAFLAHCRNARA